jgi:VanZ family protein
MTHPIRDTQMHPGSRLTRYAAWAWTGIVFLLCLWPSDKLPKSNIPLIDKWTHLVLFGGCNFLWLLAWPPAPKSARGLIRCSILVVVYGVLIEFLQTAIPSLGRSGDWVDAVADAVGVVIGAILFLLFRPWRQK